MTQSKILYGFHAVGACIRHDAARVEEVLVDASRRDRRMQAFVQTLSAANVRMRLVERDRLSGLAGTDRHQGVVACVSAERSLAGNLAELLDSLCGVPLLLVLDGVTDPHNLGACLRVADAAGAHAVIAPRDRSAGLNATVAKVASGAAETIPYLTVTNLARTIRSMQEVGIKVIGTVGDAPVNLYTAALDGPVALVMGAEGEGLRQLTRARCDELIHIPMSGSVESLNVAVASGVCLFEAVRQRRAAMIR